MEDNNSNEVSQKGVSARQHKDGAEFSAFYSGPLPAPEDFQAYNDIVPGAGKTILAAFTAQGKHRQKMEKKSVNSQVFIQALGMILSWFITLAIVVVGGYLIYKGKSLAGFTALAIALAERWYASTQGNNDRKP